MFPTAGLFRGVLCPENDEERGACKRPYCHFRHVRTVVTVEIAAEQIPAAEAKSSTSRHGKIESSGLPSHRRPKDRTPVTKPIHYVPTPLFLCKKPAEDQFAPSEDAAACEGPVEDAVLSQSGYTPTPLAELQARGDLQDVDVAASDEIEQDVRGYPSVISGNKSDRTQLAGSHQAPKERKPKADAEDLEDVIIETHTYGGVTVTTRTPKRLCKADQPTIGGDDEYDPFVADSTPESNYSGVTKQEISLKQSQYVPSKISPGDDDDMDHGPLRMDEEYPHYGNHSNEAGKDGGVDPYVTSSDSQKSGMDDYEPYANVASYSYSPASFTHMEYDPSYSYTPGENTREDFPNYSTSIRSKESNYGQEAKGHVQDDNSNNHVKKAVVKKQTSKTEKPVQSDRQHVKKKVSSSKPNKSSDTIVQQNADRKKTHLSNTSTASPEKSSAKPRSKSIDDISQRNSSNSPNVIAQKERTKSLDVNPQKIVKEKDFPQQKLSKNTKVSAKSTSNQHKSLTKNGVTKKIELSATKEKSELKHSVNLLGRKNSEEGESTDPAKTEKGGAKKGKVSSEQLANFFKKRTEMNAGKLSGKIKNAMKKSIPEPKRGDVKDSSREKVHSKTDSPAKQKQMNLKNGAGNGTPKPAPAERSLFKSFGKASPKVPPRKNAVKECGIDLFAIANDSSSEERESGDDEDFNHCVKTKNSTPRSSDHMTPRKNSTGTSSKLKPEDARQSQTKVGVPRKRTASPTREPGSKRRRGSSLSKTVKPDSTKSVELDLFGDDSDNESDVILLSESDREGSPVKSRMPSSLSTSKGKKIVAKAPASKNRDRSSSEKDVIMLDTSNSDSAESSGRAKIPSSLDPSKKGSAKPTSSKVKDRDQPASEKANVAPKPRVESNPSKKSMPSSAGNFLPSAPRKQSNILPGKSGTVKKVASTMKREATSDFEKSKHISKGERTGNGNHKNDSNRHQSHKSKPPQVKHAASTGRKVKHAKYDSSDSDLPDALGGSDDQDLDRASHYEKEPDEINKEYMEDMTRFLEESSGEEEEEDTTFDECYRIFQEGTGDPSTAGYKVKKPSVEGKEPTDKSGKQRVAHTSRFSNIRKRPTLKKANTRLSPGQMLHHRYKVMQERAARGSQEAEEGGTSAGTSVTGRKRVAHQPGDGNRTLQQLTLGSVPSKKTLAMTNAKMGKRVAHAPKTVSKRPVIPTDYGSKIPMNIRQRYLNVFIDELLKTAETDQVAFDKALEEEKVVYQRASTKSIYLNLCVNALKKLQNATAAILESPPTTPTLLSARNTVSHEAVLGGKLATKTSYSIHKHSELDGSNFQGAHLYEKLTIYIMSESLLRENGYPRPSDIPGQACFYKEEQNKTVTSSDPNQHVCVRCGTMYFRKPDGEYITKDTCTFHWGRPWTRRIAGSIESRFSCCAGDMDTKGCCIARLHVTESRYSSNLAGYMKTIDKAVQKNSHPGVYALDCEMCYTFLGLELTRVTVVNDKLEEIYDTLVKPENEIIDYNTRFSGITEADLKHVTTRLRDVQAVLLNMFSASTILVGHSLESDLVALKLLHNTVVDTAIVFPHRRGPPLKRALKTLMAEYLKRLIQDDVGGHDSSEDARSCMELMIWKAKEDAKIKRKR